jgi:hypothetical protein
MRKAIIFYFLIIGVLGFLPKANSQTNLVPDHLFENRKSKNTSPKFRTGIWLSPVYSSSKLVHSNQINKEVGFSIGLKEEFNFHKNIGIATGIEYLNYRFGFDSYFCFSGDTSYSCAKNDCAYNHRLRIHEIQIPLVIRFIIPQFYCFGGVVVFRYPLYAKGKVYSNADGQLVSKGNTKIRIFRYGPFFVETIVGGIGKEFKIKNKKQKFFIELQYKYAINAFLYSGITSDPYGLTNDLIIKNSFLLLTFGVYFNKKN